MNINEPVILFKNVIECSWESVNKISQSNDIKSYKDDWIQSNWEMIVEAYCSRESNIFIRIYGSGADCNIGSSRVWMPNATENAVVKMRRKDGHDFINLIDNSNIGDELELDYFVNWTSWYSERVPFNAALVNCEQQCVVEIDDVDFYLDFI